MLKNDEDVIIIMNHRLRPCRVAETINRKTVYFPRDKVSSGESKRVTVSFPSVPNGDDIDLNFIRFYQRLSSRDLRISIGDPSLDDLEVLATEQRRSLSNVILNKLLQNYINTAQGKSTTIDSVSSGSNEGGIKPKIGLTFQNSHKQPVHGWYHFVEGLDADYTRKAIFKYNPKTIYDPFGGSGTTQLVASTLGIQSFYSEINPFMRFVSETKVNATIWAKSNFTVFENLATSYLNLLNGNEFEDIVAGIDLVNYHTVFPNRDFFVECHLKELLAAKALAEQVAINHPEALALFRLACAANAVQSSNMTRRADLRRRRDDEYKTRVVDVKKFVSDSVTNMISDISLLSTEMAEMTKVSDSCRSLPSQYLNSFDLVITSPPYLNGTNYFRNTKLELWLLGMINSENDLKNFRRNAVCGGINNVSSSRGEYHVIATVEPLAIELDRVSKDARIPKMIRHYFSDMLDVLNNIFSVLSPGGVAVMDIGDSKFYGVHIPTDQCLIDIAREIGFRLEERNILAKRYSRDKSELVQVELIFRKPKIFNSSVISDDIHQLSLKDRITKFQETLPHKSGIFSKRNWGHNLHSLCSYQGKLKPSLAHWLIRYFVPPGGRLLDPLGGVGTIPLEAAFQGIEAISNDKSPFAAIVASAKLNPPSIIEAFEALEQISTLMERITLTDDDFIDADFGLNGKVSEYYHEQTLTEILKARKVFSQSVEPRSRAENFVWSSLLHILHGNRPYALSRKSHPITPYHPKGEFEYRDLIEKTKARMARIFSTDFPAEFLPGIGLHGDFRSLDPTQIGRFDAIITSPPFMGMRFDRPNWLRMWFCGWGEEDFHKTSLSFLERQQTQSRECYRDLINKCSELLNTNGVLIIHMGSGKKNELLVDIKSIASEEYDLIGEIVEDVQSLENHGIPDKGKTKKNHILVFKHSR